MVLRLIPKRLLTLDEIGFPPSVRELLTLPRGLILVTGPTGSGKTTTLASMLDVINSTTDAHIITIEDPIEYFHDHKSGLVNQREIGVDVPSFAEGLRRGLRQDPDVLLVGEMRDLETMETAITAAETGHLVFSTLHTTGAARTVDRIIDAFPADQQQMIRAQLSTNLKAVISQLLLPRADGTGRIAAFEVMINTPSIAALIRDSKTFRISNDILTGSKYGMVTLEQSLVNLYARGLIDRNLVTDKAQDPQAAEQLLAAITRTPISRPPPLVMNAKQVLEIFTEQGVIDQSQMDDMLEEVNHTGKTVVQVMVDYQICEELMFYQMIADALGAEFVNLEGFEPSLDILRLIPAGWQSSTKHSRSALMGRRSRLRWSILSTRKRLRSCGFALG
jgi:twitching motility protein PilT